MLPRQHPEGYITMTRLIYKETEANQDQFSVVLPHPHPPVTTRHYKGTLVASFINSEGPN